MKIVSICQPHFIPWLGYFQMIKECDKFIFLDNVQYNRRSWQNRAHIRSEFNSSKKKYLSLSVINNTRSKNINEIFIDKKNIDLINGQITNSYQKSKNFEKIRDLLINLLKQNIEENLSSINIKIITEICKILKINLDYDLSSHLKIFNFKKENLILEILKEENADVYLSNLGSKNYVHESFFEKNKIKVKYNEFIHPKYFQNTTDKLDFLPNLSVIDLLMNYDNPSDFFNRL